MSARFSITVNSLRKDYGKRTVLDADGLTIESGRAYALVGPNGSGKSTFLKVLSGVMDQTSGSVDVSGDVERDALAVGYMPQKSYVFGFSVLKNVSMVLEDRGVNREEAQTRALKALSEVGMETFAETRGSGLSGGEAQRVALARMLVQDLDVLLLDEPTASMDIAGTLLVEEALERYRERTGCLLVVATHAPSQARRIAADTVMLALGRIVEFGPTERVLSNPESPEGQEFLSYWSV
ncbi:MAG: ATP-binding cassette domain-containing protein [Eggerthellaceae bacterium]|nr:ATP-binding cassette domain-containing protein [Eggerthellaceae bacterium]